MKTNSMFVKASVAGAIMLVGGCAGQPIYQSQSPVQQYPAQGYPTQGQYPTQQYPSQGNFPQSANLGTVERMELIQRSDPNNIAGMVIGGIVGGLIGSQIGRGTGKTAATVAGVAGGAYAGNQIAQRSRSPQETFRVTVRMDSGGYQTVIEDNITDLRTGDRVRVDGNSISRY